DTNPLYLGINPYPGVTLNNGVLEFIDLTAYENLLTQLENEVEQHNADFFDSRDYMTDDEINDLAETIGFDEFKPLRDFENYFGFNSLRIQVENQINTWLSYPHSTLSGYPEDNYKIDNEIEQTLLNTSGQIIIAGNPITKDVIMGPSPGPGDTGCIWEDRKIANEDYTSGRVLKKKIIIDGESCNPSNYCTPKAMFKGKGLTFKKSGLFKKFATKMRVRLYGKAYNNLCNFFQDYDTGFNNPNLKRRYRMVVKNPYPNTNNIATKYYETTNEIQLIGNTYSLVYAP
ncbi:MAG TPA: hypothetical protein VGD31_00925, partial [Sphingobacteriaceae bacterium]